MPVTGRQRGACAALEEEATLRLACCRLTRPNRRPCRREWQRHREVMGCCKQGHGSPLHVCLPRVISVGVWDANLLHMPKAFDQGWTHGSSYARALPASLWNFVIHYISSASSKGLAKGQCIRQETSCLQLQCRNRCASILVFLCCQVLVASQTPDHIRNALQVHWLQESTLERALRAPSQLAARLPAARCARRGARQDRLQAHMRPWTAALCSLPAPPLARPARLPVLSRVACVQLGSVTLYFPASEHTVCRQGCWRPREVRYRQVRQTARWRLRQAA